MLTATLIAAALLQAAPAPMCEADGSVYRQFDFWVGAWNVYAPDGTFAGQNTISKGSGGCVIHELWTDTGGGTGHSLNFVEPTNGQWRQVWVGNGNRIDYTGGLNANGQMILTGEIVYFSAQGTATREFRGAWSPQPNGHLIQHFQQYDADSESWTEWALLTYVRQDVDTNGSAPEPGATGPIIAFSPSVWD